VGPGRSGGGHGVMQQGLSSEWLIGPKERWVLRRGGWLRVRVQSFWFIVQHPGLGRSPAASLHMLCRAGLVLRHQRRCGRRRLRRGRLRGESSGSGLKFCSFVHTFWQFSHSSTSSARAFPSSLLAPAASRRPGPLPTVAPPALVPKPPPPQARAAAAATGACSAAAPPACTPRAGGEGGGGAWEGLGGIDCGWD
jgi:hypothetical protein